MSKGSWVWTAFGLWNLGLATYVLVSYLTRPSGGAIFMTAMISLLASGGALQLASRLVRAPRPLRVAVLGAGLLLVAPVYLYMLLFVGLIPLPAGSS